MDIHCTPMDYLGQHHHQHHLHQHPHHHQHNHHQHQHSHLLHGQQVAASGPAPFQQHDQQVCLISSTVPDSTQDLLLIDDASSAAAAAAECKPRAEQFDHHQVTCQASLKQIQISTLDGYYQDLESENRLSFAQAQQLHGQANHHHHHHHLQHVNYSSANPSNVITDAWPHNLNQYGQQQLGASASVASASGAHRLAGSECSLSSPTTVQSPSTTSVLMQSQSFTFPVQSPQSVCSPSSSAGASSYSSSSSSAASGRSDNWQPGRGSSISTTTGKPTPVGCKLETELKSGKRRQTSTKKPAPKPPAAAQRKDSDKVTPKPDERVVVVKRQRRVKANDRERNRMHNLNEALERLRNHLPGGKDDNKMTKIETLKSAQEYIQTLSRLLKETNPSLTCNIVPVAIP